MFACLVSDEAVPDKTEVCTIFSKANANKTVTVGDFFRMGCANERWKVLGTVRRPTLAALISVRAPLESSATLLRAVSRTSTSELLEFTQ